MPNTRNTNVLTDWVGGGGKYSPKAVHPTNMFVRFELEPILITNAETVMWDLAGFTATECFEVEFIIVNVNAGAAAVTVSIGQDLGAGGALGGAEYWMYNEVIPYPGTSGWRGPFAVPGDDDIRAICSVNNGAAIHWKIRRIWG